MSIGFMEVNPKSVYDYTNMCINSNFDGYSGLVATTKEDK